MERLVTQAKEMAEEGVKELILVAQETTVYLSLIHIFRDGINPRILFSKVVLPIPFAPTSAILFPLSIERVTGLERGSL